MYSAPIALILFSAILLLNENENEKQSWHLLQPALISKVMSLEEFKGGKSKVSTRELNHGSLYLPTLLSQDLLITKFTKPPLF